MASPQVENGHTKIANELVEALARFNLSAYEWRVLLCVVRKTYGWRKKMDSISLGQIVSITGLTKPHICRAKNKLLNKNIILEDNGKIGLQKDYTQWKGVASIGNGSVASTGNNVASTGNDSLPNQATTKESKATSQKKKTYSRNSNEYRLAKLLLDLIVERKSDFREGQPGRREKTLQTWAKHIDWMIRLDGRTPERIEAVIQWCQADSFWQSNILSTGKLREKFDQLELKMKGSKNANRTNRECSTESAVGSTIEM